MASPTHCFSIADLKFPKMAPLRARYEALFAMRELNDSENRSGHRLQDITLVFVFSADEHVFAVAHELEMLGLSPIVNYSNLSAAELESLPPNERSTEVTYVKVRITRGRQSFWAKVL